MTYTLDEWRKRSNPLPINIPSKKENVLIGTHKNNYIIEIESISRELLQGKVLNTPPKDKHFKKGDRVIFHMDHILQSSSSSMKA